jgi:hypothetical protein
VLSWLEPQSLKDVLPLKETSSPPLRESQTVATTYILLSSPGLRLPVPSTAVPSQTKSSQHFRLQWGRCCPQSKLWKSVGTVLGVTVTLEAQVAPGALGRASCRIILGTEPQASDSSLSLGLGLTSRPLISQVLSHLSHGPSPVYFSYFSDRVSHF